MQLMIKLCVLFNFLRETCFSQKLNQKTSWPVKTLLKQLIKIHIIGLHIHPISIFSCLFVASSFT